MVSVQNHSCMICLHIHDIIHLNATIFFKPFFSYTHVFYVCLNLHHMLIHVHLVFHFIHWTFHLTKTESKTRHNRLLLILLHSTRLSGNKTILQYMIHLKNIKSTLMANNNSSTLLYCGTLYLISPLQEMLSRGWLGSDLEDFSIYALYDFY